MIALLILIVYVLGWFTWTVKVSRFATVTGTGQRALGYCHNEYDKSYEEGKKYTNFACTLFHKKRCWRTDDDRVAPEMVFKVGAIGVAWPILIFPAAAYTLANRKPTPAALVEQAKERDRYIRQLEREAGIRGN